jgi:hypothetical protein
MMDYIVAQIFSCPPPPQLKILKRGLSIKGPAYVKLIENTSLPPNSFVWTFRAHLIKFGSFLLTTQALTLSELRTIQKKGARSFTGVVRVNGLGLTLPVSVNPIMKFIYTSCKCIIFIYIHINVKSCKFILCRVKQCKCKNKYIYVALCGSISKSIYIYMILHDYVKQCKNVIFT